MKAEELLSKHNLRKTPTRISVLQKYLNADKALSHSELESVMGSDHDRVTLYRTLNAFEDSGILHKVYDENGTVRFSVCSAGCDTRSHEDNHVHFHCTRCDTSFCLENTTIPRVNIPANLSIEDVYMVVNGTCNNCLRG